MEKNFNKLQVPVYGELILGLPGETLSSWKEGINQMLDSGLNNQLFVYQAEVYPNTELGSKSYQDKHKIVTKRIQLNEIHCSPRPEGWVKEYQDIVVEKLFHDSERLAGYDSFRCIYNAFAQYESRFVYPSFFKKGVQCQLF